MQEIEQRRHLPDRERLSMLAATILLAIALARFIRLPGWDLAVQLPGIYLSVVVNVQVVVTFVVAGLTAMGADWLLRDHPVIRRRRTLEHWLLPALTAWVIGLPLFQLPLSPVWWVGFALGGVLLILVLVAEYIVVDPEDARHAMAAAGLTAVSFALYLMLATVLRYAGLRLFMLLPTLGLAAGLVSLRALRLRIPQEWAFLPAGLVALVSMQIGAGLHYWPLPPVSFALALLGPAYAMTTLFGNLADGESPPQAALEPAAVLLVIWGAALWMR
jgi:hypothetical protein